MSNSLVKDLNLCVKNKDVEGFKSQLEALTAHKIGCLGGRKFGIQGKGTLTANEIVKSFQQLFYDLQKGGILSQKSQHSIQEIFKVIEKLEDEGDDNLKKANCLQKKLTSIKRFFGNINYNRKKILKELKDDVQQLPFKIIHKTDDELKADFKSLPIVSTKNKCSVAEKNPERNRYNNVLPFDLNRYRIKGDDSFYYNASFVQDFTAIAAQAPLETNVDQQSFWRMVLDSGSSQVVMLTNFEENGKVKSSQYWPAKVGETLVFDDIHDLSVQLQNEKTNWLSGKPNVGPGIVERDIQVTDPAGKKSIIKHYQLLDWKDFGTVDVKSIITLLKRLNPPNYMTNPLICHCSAGIGRTGVFLAVSHLYFKHICNHVPIDKYTFQALVTQMRVQPSGRVGMIQTEEQYILAYRCLEELAK